MAFCLDFSDMKGFQFGSDANAALPTNVVLTENTLRESFNFESLTTNSTFFYRNLPVKFPKGAKLRASVEVRHVSGQDIQLGFDSYTQPGFGGTQGLNDNKIIGDNKDAESTGDWRELEAHHIVSPTHKYVRVVLGYFFGRIGECEFRNFRLYIDDFDLTKLVTNEPPTRRSRYLARSIRQGFTGIENGVNSAVNFGLNNATVRCDNTGNGEFALLYASHAPDVPTLLEQGVDVDNCEFFEVIVDAVPVSGLMYVYVDHFSSGNSLIASSKCLIVGNGREKHRFRFLPYKSGGQSASTTMVSVGSKGDCQGEVLVFGIDVAVYGGIEQTQEQVSPMAVTLKKESGTWKIDDNSRAEGQQRFRTLGVDEIIVSGSQMAIDYPELTNRPHWIAAVDGFGNQAAAFYAACSFATQNRVLLTVYSRANNTAQSFSSLPDNTFITLLGMGAP